MLNFRSMARRMLERGRNEILDDLKARRFPEVTPIPMEDWLKQLDARVAANAATAQAIPDPDDDENGPGDGDDASRADWEDFDRRR